MYITPIFITGTWTIHVTALGKHEGEEVPIHGNPFEVNVYDPREVLLDRDQEQTTLALGTDYAFEGT